MIFRALNRNRIRGFTLIELAIVLGIVGVLASGLWRLTATGTQQTKDVATAQQHLALVYAVQAFLSDTTTTGGQAFLGGLAPGANANLPIPLACPGTAGTQAATFCTYLPAGFIQSTTNPYGQTYTVQVRAGATNSQQNYSFMIIAQGGAKPIPDPDGGRISSLIGGNGGFVYTSTVCTIAGVAHPACGTMGSWQSDIAVYGFPEPAAATAVGWVSSLTFVSSALSSNLNWLARVIMPGDPTFAFNTMQQPANFYLGGNNFYFQDFSKLFAAATMDMQGGSVLVDAVIAPAAKNSIIDVSTNTTSPINPAGIVLEGDPNGIGYQISGKTAGGSLGGGRIQLNGDMTAPTTANPLLSVADACIGPNIPAQTFTNCGLAVSISGNVGITGMLNSNIFIYTGSDERLKKDIKPLPDSMDDLMKLRPVSFVYKSNNTLSLGFVAQELEKVYPQMVVDGQNGMKTVAYDELIAPMVKSIQELKQENDDLKASLRDQSQKQEKLEKEIQALEQEK